MPVRFAVPQDQPLSRSLRAMRREVDLCYQRSWYKRRFGYYEKPSVLRRRKKRLHKRNQQSLIHRRRRVGMYMGLITLHRREGGFP